MAKAGLFTHPGTPMRVALTSGLQRLGYQVVPQVPGAWQRSQAERNLEVVVVHGRRGRCAEIVDHYSATGASVVMIDLPHLRVEDQYRLTPPAHSWLPNFDGEGGFAPFDRLDALGIEPETRTRVKGQGILIAGQVGGDSAHGMEGGAYRRWVRDLLARIRAVSDSKVTWRPHPEELWQLDGADSYSDPREETLADALERSWALATYNSTAGLEALIAGIPVFSDGVSVYTPLSGTLSQFSKGLKPPAPDVVRDLLAAVAYTQWTLEEIAVGGPLAIAIGTEPMLPGRLAEPLPPEPPADVINPPAEDPAADPPAPAAE